jgi:hypothetical protein
VDDAEKGGVVGCSGGGGGGDDADKDLAALDDPVGSGGGPI